jgi:iron(III) transport system substrate-binding protein
MRRSARLALPLAIALAAALPACGGGDDAALTIYSGRTQDLVQPLLERFAHEEGVAIRVRYGDTAELASTILEEGENSPADVFFAQDAGALGALAEEGRLTELPAGVLEAVPAGFRSDDGLWVGVSARARVVAYSTERVDPVDLPDSIEAFTGPEWNGRIGWAPTNASFQAFVTAFRRLEGDDAAGEWLAGILANDPIEYPNNLAAVDGVADGEIDVAFVNHYYLFVLKAQEGDDYPVENHYLAGGDPGALVNVAGASILGTADRPDDAERFLRFLLSDRAQRYFAEETYEYPLVDGVPTDPRLLPLGRIEHPELDLAALSDLEGTLELLRDAGVLP